MEMESHEMKPKHILLVEDDTQDLAMTLAALAESNLAGAINVARDGAEALDYLYHRGKFATRSGGNPDLVLLDNKMPKVTGLEVLKIIKADARLKMIPVVALTSSRLPSDLAEFYLHGVNAYVVKPMGFSELVMAIQQLTIFWMAVNEPPPVVGKKVTGGRGVEEQCPDQFDGRREGGEINPATAHSQPFPAAGTNNGSRKSQ
jgi:CheY-like chemotaxis protein